MAKVLGVRFKNTPKVYYFSPISEEERYKEGSGVIVDTAKGYEYATVVFDAKEVPDDKIIHPLKPIVRKATEEDERCMKENEAKIPETMRYAEEKIAEAGLSMKLISCEYSIDGKKLSFFFSSDKRVDFRELVKSLAAHFHLRIELRQVGIRDETRILGGIAPCGRTCCCAGSLVDFGKVTIKMAKNQGLHLNPGKISGLCGRLMCCLEYENDYYEVACKKVPRVGSTVGTPDGNGIVVSNDMLRMITKVKIPKEGGGEVYKDFSSADLKFKKSCGGCVQCGNEKGEDDSDEIPENIEEISD